MAYGACKAHLERFSQGLAAELWEDGIAVNALSPDRGIASEGQRWFRQQAGRGSFVGSRENGEIMGDAAAISFFTSPQGERFYTRPIETFLEWGLVLLLGIGMLLLSWKLFGRGKPGRTG